jgi:cob(I)alamin adenosyltransferase
MSIATKTGDDGTTALMYGRRVPKTDPRVAAYGTCDELNAALGMVRAFCAEPLVTDSVLAIQRSLVTLMAELAVAAEDRQRYTEMVTSSSPRPWSMALPRRSRTSSRITISISPTGPPPAARKRAPSWN